MSGARRKVGPTSPSPSTSPAPGAARRRAGGASRTKSPVKPSSARRSSCNITAGGGGLGFARDREERGQRVRVHKFRGGEKLATESGLQIPNPTDFNEFHQISAEITEFDNHAEEPGKERQGGTEFRRIC
jgi:hypothetical protein